MAKLTDGQKEELRAMLEKYKVTEVIHARNGRWEYTILADNTQYYVKEPWYRV